MNIIKIQKIWRILIKFEREDYTAILLMIQISALRGKIYEEQNKKA